MVPHAPVRALLAADRIFVPVAITAEEAREQNRVAEAMARFMLDRASIIGACDVHDLANAGFTAAEIIEYEREARAIAERAANRQDRSVETVSDPAEAA